MSECRNNHATMTTPFCAECGARNAVVREPGEITRMRAVVKRLLDEAPRSDRVGGLLLMIAADASLSWASGEMTDEKYLDLMRTAITGREQP